VESKLLVVRHLITAVADLGGMCSLNKQTAGSYLQETG